MKIVLVFVTMWNGQLSYSEQFPFKSMDDCRKTFAHLLELYQADGRDLSQVNGECYWKSAE
jgi:hypothetical protein